MHFLHVLKNALGGFRRRAFVFCFAIVFCNCVSQLCSAICVASVCCKCALQVFFASVFCNRLLQIREVLTVAKAQEVVTVAKVQEVLTVVKSKKS